MGLRRFISALKPVLSLVALVLQIGCAQKDPVEQILPSSKSTCGGQAIQGQYLVQWQDESVSKIKDDDLEHFKDATLRPNISQIKRVEFDQKFSAEDFAISAVSRIDNWGYRAINVEALWQLGIRGKNVLIAVVDSGVDVTHPILASRIAVNAGESNGLSNNGVDDDHNGYVDDVEGFSFYDNTTDLTDNVFHGTHVAGVIAGEHTHTTVVDDELLGLAPESKILPVKFLDQDGGTLSSAIEAVEYAVTRGAKIINASWGGSGCSEILREKIAGLEARGVLFVAASGNSGRNIESSPEYPAAFNSRTQITVGALSPFLGMANFSNYSDRLVHIFAPGQDIVSSVPGGKAMSLSGTSMAAPFISGAAALIWSAKPSLTLYEVRDVLLKSVSIDNTYSNATHGRIDLAKAVSLIR